MAVLMNKKRPGHIPAFIIRLVLGKDFYEIIRLNCKVSNAKAKKDYWTGNLNIHHTKKD